MASRSSLGRIGDADSLFRHCIHPTAFKGNKKKRFASGLLIHWKPVDDGSGLEGSVVWQRYVPTAQQLHRSGCRHAFGRTQNEKMRLTYCGAYELKAHAIRALVSAENLDEIVGADAVHKIEEGEIAHTALKIFLRPGVPNIHATMTAISDRLWNSCSGPLTHKCDSDLDLNPHPSENLETPPRGPYSDARSRLCRLGYLIRFHIHYWLWRLFWQ